MNTVRLGSLTAHFRTQLRAKALLRSSCSRPVYRNRLTLLPRCEASQVDLRPEINLDQSLGTKRENIYQQVLIDEQSNKESTTTARGRFNVKKAEGQIARFCPNITYW